MTDKKKKEILPEKKRGVTRIVHAVNFSLNGLKHAITNEIAFRQELLLSVILIVSAFVIPVKNDTRLLMIIAPLFVLIVELLNSAIEKVVDLASPDYHEFAKQAKDMSSLAVLISIIILISIWGYGIFTAISAP